ncbi:MAG: rubrerythrin family protein [Sphingobacteriales bacterium 17-39-43]|uniref:VIT1/CCC1 transporter family protein n=1 Tax=Daejeonella sp. TaxID=2805397 RepID=UPI000BD7806D|nr:VIT1/CCC1 transporter family protein [Daejeonella sp.]OYZ31678.1 MAG: rubrerythrin family protein [Sphingobacteriales bacterium 16-39-50]OZA25073.1 MAG: rubrerythrin family protein [Sphingobacteriales bacterium 17-39-43]HQT23658.1 VIT1/CCC1 transporter family protein [Daejeonella sp.]HQT56951.1 VIT1/CCC1 transporter family protein [Daejeonella sp.]
MKNKNIQTEIDACFLYQRLAEHEPDAMIANVFRQMSDIERSHAEAFAKKENINFENLMQPSWRAKTLNTIGKIFGYDYVLGVLMDTEKSIANAIIATKNKNKQEITGTETNHVKILRTILEKETKVTGTQLSRFESRHRSVGGNAIRAAVLGGNDGLVSNFSLVMGIAGATAGQSAVLLAGLAGLLAGALSMALGEWISVTSSKELYENQMQIEMEELETNPEGEMRELALIYIAKGIPEEQAHQMAADIMKDKDHAHEILIKEELGINAEELKGSAFEAAIYSFILFSIGAVIPVLPFMLFTGIHAILISVIASAIGLFLIGAAITLFTGKNVWYSGFRQVLFGLIAAAITFGIGNLIGVSVNG